MNYVNEGLYFEASNLANSLSKDVGRYYNLPVEKVKCFHIQEYIEQVEDVEFLNIDFGTHLNKLMVGSIAKVYDEVLVSINKNVMLERQLFTSMHEIGHFYFDLPDLEKGSPLSDMLSEDGYFPEDLPREYRANVTASVLMANDEALRYAINRFPSYQNVCNYFYMSKAALQNRLVEYLSYVQNCTSQYAFSLVNDYRYSDGKKFRNVFFK